MVASLLMPLMLGAFGILMSRKGRRLLDPSVHMREAALLNCIYAVGRFAANTLTSTDTCFVLFVSCVVSI